MKLQHHPADPFVDHLVHIVHILATGATCIVPLLEIALLASIIS